MITANEVKLINVADQTELLSYYEGISSLFDSSFGKPLDRELWTWAYQNNPFGEPIVSIAVCDGKVVGHYAVIAMDLENENSKLKGYLSMTTMVDVEYRKLGLFKTLAEMVYERIENLKDPAVVFGFPNDNSTPGFIKKLGWTVSDSYKVVRVQPNKISYVADVLESIRSKKPYTLNLEKQEICEWRTEKPSQIWEYRNGIGVKKIGEEYDLMHVGPTGNLRELQLETPCNIILPIDDIIDPSNGIEVSFPYRFGYRLFNSDQIPNIFVQMSMSDVF